MSKQSNSRYGHTSDFDQIEEFLDKHYQFRYNSVLNQIEFIVKVTEDSNVISEKMPLDDYYFNSIYRALRKEDIKATKDDLKSVLTSDFVEAFDPFKEYFEALQPWDNVDYLKQLADTVTVAEEDREIWELYLRRWLIASVACAIDESVSNQSVLIFIGGQGIGKTTWMNKIIPASLISYYYSGTIDPGNKDTKIHLSECLFINLDELENLNRGDAGSLKSLITLKTIKLRRPYGISAETMPRRASFMGSVNNSEFLNDHTGSRRYLCIEAWEIEFLHNINMDNVYSQAYYLYKNDEQYWFSSEENDKITSYNQRYKVEHVELEYVRQIFEPCLRSDENCTPLQLTEILLFLKSKCVGHPIVNQRRLGIAMKASEFTRTKYDGQWLYLVKFKNCQ